MKKFINLTLLLLNVFLGYAQTRSITLTPDATIKTSIDTQLTGPTKLYDNALKWIKNNPNITLTNVDANKIVAKGIAVNVWTPTRGGIQSFYNVVYTLQLEVVNGAIDLNYHFENFIKDGKRLPVTPKDLFRKHNGSIKYLFQDMVKGIEKEIKNTNIDLYKFINNSSDDILLVSKSRNP